MLLLFFLSFFFFGEGMQDAPSLMLWEVVDGWTLQEVIRGAEPE